MQKLRPLIVLGAILVLPVLLAVVGDLVFELGIFKTRNVSRPLKIVSPKIPDPDGGPDSVYKIISDFDFIDQNGTHITRDSFLGKIWVANVFFSRCKDICPKLSTGMKEIQEEYKDDPSVKLLSISVDPKNDSQEVLKQYAEEYGAIPGKWHLITGSKDELYRFAKEEFWFKAEEGEDEQILFVHDEEMRLIDKDGRMRARCFEGTPCNDLFWDGTEPSEIDSLITSIFVLKNE